MKIESEINQILKNVYRLKIDPYNVELLTYQAGCTLAVLKQLGCPLDIDAIQRTVDEWANSLPQTQEEK